MPFHIIELDKPNLPKVKMQCDNAIDPKLEEIPAIKQCFSKSNVTMISGGMGSGKTTLTMQMIKGIFKGCYETIILIMPENSFDSLNEKDKRYLQKHLVNDDGETTIYHEFDEEILSNIYSMLEDNSTNKYNTLIIIDDYGAEFKRKPIELMLNRICLKNRHLRASILMLTQNYYMMPKKIREICNNIIMFNTNKSQNQKLFQEQFDINENEFKELMKLVPTRHDYLLLNLNYKKIYHNWNEIVFDK